MGTAVSGAVIAGILLTGCGQSGAAPSPSSSAVASASVAAADADLSGALTLDPEGWYGDVYADGILPVGDGRYSEVKPAVGTVYLCSENFAQNGAGAQERGPWFINDDTEWDLSLKIHVQGAVEWEPQMTVTLDGDTRTVTTNDLPDHTTGEFPVARDDPAYDYDRNPNSISAQELTYDLNASPQYGEPHCMGGEAGVMLTGAALFNAFDELGRDAGAWEIQDACEGHPQQAGEYHYHTLSSCIGAVSVETVIGFALDGFPITGPTVSEGNVLTTADLDECHGIVSDVELDGETVTTYHYVMTQDFPYSVSCFRAEPITMHPAH
ncbi:YHYH protein [Microbacterium sediminicola]|uniref:YHYH protein n=2 Tax=Microbacterium sediminicola TaxID=415210 RepID=A0ABN2I559_9MICO